MHAEDATKGDTLAQEGTTVIRKFATSQVLLLLSELRNKLVSEPNIVLSLTVTTLTPIHHDQVADGYHAIESYTAATTSSGVGSRCTCSHGHSD